MSNYRDIAKKALSENIEQPKQLINESVLYPNNLSERMHPILEKELAEQKHSLGKHPAFPDGHEYNFDQVILGKRFEEVCKRYKRAFDITNINNRDVLVEGSKNLIETINIESKHKKKLVELAVKMIRDEFDMPEDVVDIDAELTTTINLEGMVLDEGDDTSLEFDSHDDIVNANAEVYKRRFINCLIQGAAKKCNHMFHMVDEELTEIDPRLPNKYSKLMSSADYTYFIVPPMEEGITGGKVSVVMETEDENNGKPKIKAQAMVFPVLIHELVKGVMELISMNGLPQKKELAEFVISKADFLKAEPWDMRLGPAIWERITTLINADDFNLKHQIYYELIKLPANEFHQKMKEIMAGTNKGKAIINDITDEIKKEIKDEEYRKAMNEIGFNDGDPDDDIDINNFEEFL